MGPALFQLAMLMYEMSWRRVSGKLIPSLGITVTSQTPSMPMPLCPLCMSSGARPLPATLAALSKTTPPAAPGCTFERSITGERQSLGRGGPSGHGVLKVSPNR